MNIPKYSVTSFSIGPIIGAMAVLQNYHVLVWLVIAIVLACIEVISTSLGFILASLSALIACGLATYEVRLEYQVVAFSIAMVLSLGLLRPKLLKLMHRGTKTLPGRTEALVGKRGQVTDDISTAGGRVMVEDQDWAARSDKILKSGAAIKVIGHDGIVLIVEEVK